MASQDSLPEIVRDSKLQASIQDNITTHNRLPGCRNGRRNDRWTRERLLGSGGYGVVFLERKAESAQEADDPSMARLRAVKCIKVSQEPSGLEKYVRELQALAKFSQVKYSNHFVNFFGWYEVSGWLHIAMEYCEHGDLRGYLSEHETMPESHVQDVAHQVLAALAFMHDEKFAHRDLKPANILIKSKPPREWWVKVADLGLSKRAEGTVSSATVRGTENFMAPETRGFPFGGKPSLADPFAADMWSLGETIFRALVGHSTFEDPQRLVMYQKGQVGFPADSLARVRGSSLVVSLLWSLMAAEPSARITAKDALQHHWLVVESEQTAEVSSRDITHQPAVPALYEISEPSGQWTATVSRRDSKTLIKQAKTAEKSAAGASPIKPGSSPRLSSSSRSITPPVGPTSSPPSIPQGWTAQWDHISGTYYFVQFSTGLSQWEIPTKPAPAGPDPPLPRSPIKTGTAYARMIMHPDGTQTAQFPDGSLAPILPSIDKMWKQLKKHEQGEATQKTRQPVGIHHRGKSLQGSKKAAVTESSDSEPGYLADAIPIKKQRYRSEKEKAQPAEISDGEFGYLADVRPTKNQREKSEKSRLSAQGKPKVASRDDTLADRQNQATRAGSSEELIHTAREHGAVRTAPANYDWTDTASGLRIKKGARLSIVQEGEGWGDVLAHRGAAYVTITVPSSLIVPSTTQAAVSWA